MKRTFYFRLSVFLLCITFLLTGCRSSGTAKDHTSSNEKSIYNESYADLFDTYVVFTIYGISEEDFYEVSAGLHDYLLAFHQETDIYNTYEGMTGLGDINEHAGKEPIKVSSQLMDFLHFCIQAETDTLGTVNVMLGSVTSLWHEARETGILPSSDLLQEASEHTDISLLQLDDEAMTVLITDAEASLDVGALAKGYAGRLAKQYLADIGIENYLLDLGGNILTSGCPQGTGRDKFTIGLQDPTKPTGSYKETAQLSSECAVTSGDYQRFFEVDGIRYHHIIDPSTLLPGTLHHSVTVIHEDSAIADMLSTALFLLSEEDGLELADRFGAKVIYQDDMK